jgi:hypothetical protein
MRTPSQLKELFDLANKKAKYISPPGYGEWDQYVQGLIRTLLRCDHEESKEHPATLSIWTVLQQQAPAFFVTEEITAALINTSLPKLPSEIKTPLESFHIMLPLSMEPIKGCAIQHMVVKIFKHKDEHCGSLVNWISCFCIVSTNGRRIAADFRASLYNPEDRYLMANPHLPEDIAVAAFKFAFNFILLTQHRPELITEEAPSLPSGSGFGGWRPSKNKYLPIRWLGKNYKRPTTTSSGAGSHASPLAHWRRGHWHHFRCGEKRQNLRLKWVEPVFVNAAP